MKRKYSINNTYAEWIKKNEIENSARIADNLEKKYCFAFVYYTEWLGSNYNLLEESLRKCSYDNWKLYVVSNTFDNTSMDISPDDRIHFYTLTEFESISVDKLGDYACLLVRNGILHESALELIMHEIMNDNPKMIYSDEDTINICSGKRYLPQFKPNWNPELLLNYFYIDNLTLMNTNYLVEIGITNIPKTIEDYYYTVLCGYSRLNTGVSHIAKILYHGLKGCKFKRLSNNKDYVIKNQFLSQRKISAHVKKENSYNIIVYDLCDTPKVSIIICSKNHFMLLKRCIESIVKFTDYSNYEIIIVDNGSEKKTRKKIEAYIKTKSVKIRYLYDKSEFNFSAMCNEGVDICEGDYVLLLNDDVEIVQVDWLSVMLGQAVQKGIGAVGCKLYYPCSTIIQHAGVTNAKDGFAISFHGLNDNKDYDFKLNKLPNNVISVLGACLLIKKDLYLKYKLDEYLAVTYNESDLCVYMYELGLHNIVRNDVICWHHESLSRGFSLDDAKRLREILEYSYFHKKHSWLIDGQDPFMNSNKYFYNGRQNILNGTLDFYFDRLKMQATLILDFCESVDKVYIYGTGQYSKKITLLAYLYDVKIEGYIVTKLINKTVVKVNDVKLYEISTVDFDSNDGVIVAMNEYYQKQVIPLLEEKSVKNIYLCN